ncbi:MAG: hypothetical protein ACM358_14060 [Gemmatimonadota bacterium]
MTVTKEHRPSGDEANPGDATSGVATSGVARSPSAGEVNLTEPDEYVKRLHESIARESRLTVVLSLEDIEGLVEARRCVGEHCCSTERDDKWHAKALRTIDRLLGRRSEVG